MQVAVGVLGDGRSGCGDEARLRHTKASGLGDVHRVILSSLGELCARTTFRLGSKDRSRLISGLE